MLKQILASTTCFAVANGTLGQETTVPVPAPLAALYKANALDPDSPCLRPPIPKTDAEHADREKCMLQEIIDHGGRLAETQPYLRNLVNGAKQMEDRATRTEEKYRQAAN